MSILFCIPSDDGLTAEVALLIVNHTVRVGLVTVVEQCFRSQDRELDVWGCLLRANEVRESLDWK